jgi:integrase
VNNSPASGKKISTKPKRANGRGSIYQITKSNGRKVWKAAIKDINGKLRTKNFTKLSEAEDWVADQRRARDLGENTYATNPKMTVAEFLVGWANTQYGPDQESTQRSYLSVIKNHIAPAIGKIKAAELNTKTVENLFRDMHANGSGAGTIRITRAAISAAYNDAVRLGDLVRNPVRNTKMPNVTSKTTKPLPRNDWEKVYLEAMKNPRMHARIEVAGMLGLRPGEALGLKWSDLNVVECTLLVERQVQRAKGRGLVIKPVKQKTARTLKISQQTVQILLTHKRHQSLNKAKWNEDSDLIFPNTVGRLGDEKSDRLAFKNLLKAAGLSDFQLYQLRKTAFTAMAGQTDLKTLMEFSGHTQISTVIQSYVHGTSESMTLAIARLDATRPSMVDGNHQSCSV